MKFARIVFWIAAAWGFLSLTPLYFLFDTIGRKTPPPLTHPGFYYGFVGAALAWQFAFLVIGADPHRYRSMMIPAILEKFLYGIALTVLYFEGRTPRSEMTGFVDLLFGVLFIIAFLKSKPRERRL
jgi:hypothetical protein